MANHIDLINLSNATHNGTVPPTGWDLIINKDGANFKSFGSITTQAYRGPNNEVVLTIKGSEITDVGDWLSTNPAFVSGGYPDQMRELVAYAKELNDKYNPNDDGSISVTGFSQGGGLAQLLSHTFGWQGNAQNAPGARRIVDNQAYQNQLSELDIEPKGIPEGFVSIQEQGDPVSSAGDQMGEQVVLDITPDTSALGSLLITSGVAAAGPAGVVLALAGLGVDALNNHDLQALTDRVAAMSEEEKATFLEQLKEEAEALQANQPIEHTQGAQLAGTGASAAFMSYARLNGWMEEDWLDEAWEQSVASFAITEAAKDIADWHFQGQDYNLLDWDAAGGSLVASLAANAIGDELGLGGSDAASVVGTSMAISGMSYTINALTTSANFYASAEAAKAAAQAAQAAGESAQTVNAISNSANLAGSMANAGALVTELDLAAIAHDNYKKAA